MVINLKEIIKEHLKWIENEAQGKRADFTGLDLSKEVLSGLFLKKALFVDCNLTGAQMRGGDFSDCDFTNAILDDVDARFAQFSSTKFIGVQCKNGNFFGAKLNNTNFNNSSLLGVNFLGAQLKESDFTKADIKQSNFSKANIAISNLLENIGNDSVINGVKIKDDCNLKFTIKGRCSYSATKCDCVHVQSFIDSSLKGFYHG